MYNKTCLLVLSQIHAISPVSLLFWKNYTDFLIIELNFQNYYPCLKVFTLGISTIFFIHISSYIAVSVTPSTVKVRGCFLLLHSFYHRSSSQLRSFTSVLLLMLLLCGMCSQMMCTCPIYLQQGIPTIVLKQFNPGILSNSFDLVNCTEWNKRGPSTEI